MQKALLTFGLASVLLTGVAATGFAASPETPADRSQGVTGTHQTMPRTPTGSMTTTGMKDTTSQAAGPDATRPATPMQSGGEGTSGGGAASGGAGAGGASR
jgi:hypothetical protein